MGTAIVRVNLVRASHVACDKIDTGFCMRIFVIGSPKV